MAIDETKEHRLYGGSRGGNWSVWVADTLIKNDYQLDWGFVDYNDVQRGMSWLRRVASPSELRIYMEIYEKDYPKKKKKKGKRGKKKK